MINKIFLVLSRVDFENENIKNIENKLIDKLPFEKFDYENEITNFDEDNLYLLYLDDEKIKIFFNKILNKNIKIAILPNENALRAMKSYGLSNNIDEAIQDYISNNEAISIDLLICNNEPTFTNIVIGDVHGLNQSSTQNKSIIFKITDFFSNLKNLNFQEFTLITSKEQEIQTAATGIMILEHNVKQSNYNFINEDLSLHDGKLNAFILSPTSILSYIYFLIMVFFYNRFSFSSLPKSIGIVKTSKLSILNEEGIDFKIDGVIKNSKKIELEVHKDCLNIVLGKYTTETVENTEIDDRDIIKIHNLPKDKIKDMLINEPIPFFKKAREDDFKDLFISLRESAKLNSIFIVLMILSTLLATTGLFQSSAPVVIGAMILAPLMAPIVSLAMGVVRVDNMLLVSSLKTLFIGISLALLCSSLYTYFIPLSFITDEMKGRLNPNILDLAVAVISGIAGAYAHAKSEVAKSLAGVAIAVALVPPLSVTGIGLGWMDFNIIYGSFLLFLTNLVGITLSAALTFVILGYSPLKRAKFGLFYTAVVLVIVTIPLVISFNKLIEQNNILNKLNNKSFIINEKTVELNVLDIDLNDNFPIISLKTNSNDIFKKEDLILLKEKIESTVGKKVKINVSSQINIE